ncbi:MAG: acyltransferase family protein [Candidatus Bathyarchaeota archaeon]|nr:acyltransferase family protein [Candidatus Bathyarchaeota archaeon]
MDPESSGTSLPVDLIRTVAIVLVILLHAAIEPNPALSQMSPEGVALWWTSDIYNSIARVCVPLFIMLTGALLLQPSKTNEPLGAFFKKRWNRIGIPVLFWAGLYFIWDFLVRGEALTPTSFVQGLLAGPYVHFWFIYILIGLYLITPLVRVFVAYASWKVIRYFFLLWIVGTAVIPLLTLIADISPAATWFGESVFLLTGLVGYFILGAFWSKLKLRIWVLAAMFTLSTLWTIVATYFLVGALGESYSQFFLGATSFSVIVASVSLFGILASTSNVALQTRYPNASRVLAVISANTLPIYLLHIMVLETLQRGYLGFQLSVTTLNPVIEIPLVTALTLLICLAIIVPLKKLPYVGRIIG